MVDANVCNGSDPAGCATLHPARDSHRRRPRSRSSSTRRPRRSTPANQVDNDVSVIDACRCNAEMTSGCRPGPDRPCRSWPRGSPPTPPSTRSTPRPEPTAYRWSTRRPATARRGRAARSRRQQLTVGTAPARSRSTRTHTVYVANAGAATRRHGVGDRRPHCNATDPAGCCDGSTLQVPGGNPDDIAVMPHRHRLRRHHHRQRVRPAVRVQRRHVQCHHHVRLRPDPGHARARRLRGTPPETPS